MPFNWADTIAPTTELTNLVG